MRGTTSGDQARLHLEGGSVFLDPAGTPPGALPRTRRVFVPGVGYVAEQERPIEFRHANGPPGTPGNTPYVRPQAKPLSRKARRRRGLET